MVSDFISLFFPRYCVACHNALNKKEDLICISCQHEIPKTNSHVDRPNFVEGKFYGKVLLTHAVAMYRFERKGRIQRILHQLKYGNQPEIGQLIGKIYGTELKAYDLQNSFDLIVPVPLHHAKLRRRGYNQSAQFGEGLSAALNLKQEPYLLKRIRQTATQTRKSRLERWKNVEQIFEVPFPEVIREKRVLLVDDVITTGSTLESAARSLMDSGAKSVGVAAMAAAN